LIIVLFGRLKFVSYLLLFLQKFSINKILSKYNNKDMDTDDLSQEAYKAIILTAERFHHDLTLRFGCLSYGCDTESDYLDAAEKMINIWLTEWELQKIIAKIFFDNPPDKEQFKKVLENILLNIDAVRKIPINQRHFDFY
jgi:hypothetical protein